jgi:crotonobetainyl-CoA:carnitine CoA-transferase CaiB-like acyl-CoA transferase
MLRDFGASVVKVEDPGWVASLPRAAALKVLDEFEVVSAPVNDARDIAGDPHFIERTLVELTGSAPLGAAVMPGPVLHLASSSVPVYDGVPSVGEHTASVLTGALEMSPAELAELAGRGVIAAP